jgi:hypothetical protein
MDYGGGFGGGGRLYIVSSLISPLIITVTVLLDYNGAHQRPGLRYSTGHIRIICFIPVHILFPFKYVYGLCDLSGNSEVLYLTEYASLVMTCNFDATCL